LQAKEYLANPEAFVVAAPVATDAAPAVETAAEEKEEEKEESDDDMVSKTSQISTIVF
jgi:large subunit ribosomal protein LP0